jgi:hypothetical protein
LIWLTIAVLAPIPRATVRTAMVEKPGLRAQSRNASHVEHDLLDAAPTPRRPDVLVRQRWISECQARGPRCVIGREPLPCAFLGLEVEVILNFAIDVLVRRLSGVPGHVTAPRWSSAT